MTSSFYKMCRATFSCLSLDGDHVSPGEGWLHGVVDAHHSHVQRVATLRRFSCGKLAGEIGESASDVVVRDMVPRRLPSTN